MNLNDVQSFANGDAAAKLANRWLAFDASANAIYADSTHTNVIGTLLSDRSATDIEPCDVALHNKGGVHFATASAAIALGAEVMLAANGKIATVAATGTARGIALQAASGDGSVIRVYVFPGASEFTGAIPAQTQTALTDNSGGTPATTIAAITQAGTAGSADITPTKNAIASLAAELALVKADVAAILAYLG